MDISTNFTISSLVYAVFAFISGLCTALWRFVSIMSRLALAEQKITHLEEGLERIENKLDAYFLKKVEHEA